jgi:UDP-galactopyranose mutase
MIVSLTIRIYRSAVVDRRNLRMCSLVKAIEEFYNDKSIQIPIQLNKITYLDDGKRSTDPRDGQIVKNTQIRMTTKVLHNFKNIEIRTVAKLSSTFRA